MKEKTTAQQVHTALSVIIKNAHLPSLNYAVNYAKAGMRMNDDEFLQTQVVYVLNNIEHWTGDAAKDVRRILKDFVGIK